MAKAKSKSAAKDLIAGGTAGAIEVLIMYPTELVKTKMQLAEKASGLQGQQFKGPLDFASHLYREKGIFSFYRGMSTLIIGSIPKAAVRFAAFEKISSLLRDDTGKLSTASTLLAGLGAGASEAIIAVTPMETIKTKLIHDQNSLTPKYKGLFHGVSQIIKTEGISGIYKGVIPTTAKQATNQMVRFTVYGFIKKQWQQGDSSYDLSLWQSLVSGSIAGAVSVYATMPMDVVKTKMQGLEASKYKGSLDCLSTILRNDGVLALWKGTTPRLSRVMFSGGIIFACYEQVLKYLSVVWPEPE